MQIWHLRTIDWVHCTTDPSNSPHIKVAVKNDKKLTQDRKVMVANLGLRPSLDIQFNAGFFLYALLQVT